MADNVSSTKNMLGIVKTEVERRAWLTSKGHLGVGKTDAGEVDAGCRMP